MGCLRSGDLNEERYRPLPSVSEYRREIGTGEIGGAAPLTEIDLLVALEQCEQPRITSLEMGAIRG
jgi:hypothetical protein